MMRQLRSSRTKYPGFHSSWLDSNRPIRRTPAAASRDALAPSRAARSAPKFVLGPLTLRPRQV
jgi:hypothetical protein